MANLNTLTFAQVVQQIAAAAQAQSPLPFNLGSPELALAEADAGVVMWLQSLIVEVLTETRASTSQGPDLDSWMADFGIVTRKPAIAATGNVTFSRYTATAQAVIPVGTLLQTSDGTQQFTAIADTTQASWNSTLNAYVIPAGTASANATVQAVTPGAAGNVNANTITTIAQALPGVDTVTNSQPFTNGQNAESDAALLQRFQLTLAGLKDGIKASAAAAIEALQLGVQFSIVENQTLAGQTQNGFFYVIISPYNTTTQQAVYSAVDSVRPLSVTFAVYAATQLAANVSVTVTAAAGYTHAQVAPSVQTALQNFIAQTALGAGLNYSQLYAIIWGVPGVADATGLLLNGGTTDIAGNAQTVIVPGVITVN
jgi:uncharacterized phage protein gp47/JayE